MPCVVVLAFVSQRFIIVELSLLSRSTRQNKELNSDPLETQIKLRMEFCNRTILPCQYNCPPSPLFCGRAAYEHIRPSVALLRTNTFHSLLEIFSVF
jgi:hypothetical protein